MAAKPTYETLAQRVRELERQVERYRTEAVTYRTLFNDFPHGITVSDARGNIVESNAAASALLGIGKEQHESRTIDGEEWRIIRPDGTNLPPAEWPSVIALNEQRPVVDHEMGVARPGGEIVWLNVTAAPLPVSGLGVVVTYSDISERRHHETRFRKFFENAGFYGYLISPEGMILEANQNALDQMGYAREELVGRPYTVLYAPESVAEAKRLFRQWTATGKVREAELAIVTKAGEKRWVLLSADAVRDAGGNLLHSTSIQTDITERKRLEAALIESRNELQRTLAATTDGIWGWNFQTNALSFSPTYYTMLGYPPDAFPPSYESWLDLIHPEDRDRALATAAEYLKTKPDQYENVFRLRTKDGGYRWIRARARVAERDADGNAVYMIGNHEDITDLKRAESGLQKSEERYRKLVNTAPYGIQLTDREGRIVFSNPMHHRIQGYEDGALIGKHIWDLMADAAHKERTKAYYRRIIESRPTPQTYYNRDRTRDGREIDVQIDWDYIVDENGELEGIISVISDITNQIAMESNLRKAQRMEAIGSLAGGIAHDFNNILFPIVGISEMLMEDLPPGSFERDSVAEIFKAGKRGSDLVKQILAFSRQTEHKMIPTRIQNILKEVLTLSRSSIPAYIDIRRDIQADCGTVLADPTQVHQIAMNIVTNAYHAVEDNGGHITIALKETTVDRTESIGATLQPGRYAELSIADTGHGMSADIVEKIFDPYFTTKAQGKGTGLGLAVVYGIVKEHRGDIRVDSAVGRGSVFRVYLPLMETSGTTEAAPMPGENPTGSERILLIDDEPAIARLEKQMLERLGYRVTTHVSSLEALEAFRSDPHAFDLIISDMSMPNLAGDQFADAVKSVRPDIPVIVCTGYSTRIDDEKAAAHGIAGILMKPIIKSDMAAMVRAVLDAPSAADRRG